MPAGIRFDTSGPPLKTAMPAGFRFEEMLREHASGLPLET